MIMKSIIIASLGFAMLAGCSTTRLAQTQAVAAAIPADLAGACAIVNKNEGIASGVLKGGAANTVANVAPYIDSVCATSQAMAAVAADPTTVAWVNGLNSTVVTAIGSTAKPAT
jgi:hypothetical protein